MDQKPTSIAPTGATTAAAMRPSTMILAATMRPASPVQWYSEVVGVAAKASRLPALAATLMVAAMFAAATGSRASPAPSCGARGVSLQVLGSGGPELQDRRASSSYLLWWDGVPRVLVDSGGGSALRFGESGASVSGLAVILLTHLHVDHTADLAALVKSSFFEERHERLPVFGPAGNASFPATSRFLRTLFAGPAGAYRYLADFVNPTAPDPYLLEPHDLALGRLEIRTAFDARGIRVLAARVVHGGVPAVAYRVEMGGARVAFSGDTDGNNGNLERLARDVDLFVAHNAVREGATGVERALHMPPSVIGRISRDAAVKRLLLSHRMLRTLGYEDETEARVREAFAGPITFADDLDCFPIP
jgi:ribonuclease BN (tRNA processing enzyme)